jgi:betaine reductase
MSFPIVSNVSYFLAHTPGLLMDCGQTQCIERITNPQGAYLSNLERSLRSYDEAVGYAPHQVFIGNMSPDELKGILRPWYQNLIPDAKRYGRFGEIMPELEFVGVMKIVDSFELVNLEIEFTAQVKEALGSHALFSVKELERLGKGIAQAQIDEMVINGAVPIIIHNKQVGCVKKAHEYDPNLSAHVIMENIITKASGVMAAKHVVEKQQAEEIEYIIECSEEACGDMYQRGGGNFAKSIGEMCGCLAATGSDTRGFCAAPNHALMQAAALVQAGIFKSVMVVAGGSAAKLGMNGRDHIAKGLPVLEDVIGGFALVIKPNDGKSAMIRTDLIGRHRIGSGSSPQAAMQAIITEPLDRGQLKLADIDKYAAEMQNPEITEPAGAGDVSRANYRMIAALAVLKGEIERSAIPEFVEKHGIPGFAPTQGHIPSGVPFIGHAVDSINNGSIEKAMIIAKGSLFLGRMTNLFDGVSIILERNDGNSGQREEHSSKAELKAILANVFRQAAETLSGQD